LHSGKNFFATSIQQKMNYEKLKASIEACNQCATECEQCITACCNEKESASMDQCIELNRYSADMSRMAAAFIARADKHTMDFVNKFCDLCAEICTACATECEKHSDMEHCKRCAIACRNCAAECLIMTKANKAQSA
jgi:hypothetical protein